MYNKDAAIAAQSAVKAAAELYAGSGQIDAAIQAAQGFYNLITQISGDPTTAASQPVQQSIPAVQPAQQQATQPAMAQAVQNVQAAMPGSVVVRDLQSEEGRWKDVFANPNDWYNNVGDTRASSGGGKGPDFKFKHSEEVKSLWLNGKYGPAPAWVFERLGLQFPGGLPAQAPQGQVVPTPF